MLPLRTRVDLGSMAMKEYSAFPKAPALLETHHQIAYPGHSLGAFSLCKVSVDVFYSPSRLGWDGLVSYQDTRWREVLPLCRDAVGVFYSPSRLGWDGLVSYPRHSLEGGLTPWQRCSRSILQPQPTGLRWFSVISTILVGGRSYPFAEMQPEDSTVPQT